MKGKSKVLKIIVREADLTCNGSCRSRNVF